MNGSWRFCFDNERRYANPAEIEAGPTRITVPYPPASKASGIGDRGFHEARWDQREFDKPHQELSVAHSRVAWSQKNRDELIRICRFHEMLLAAGGP